jgi:DNA-binding NarL/FixJ family response regulator
MVKIEFNKKKLGLVSASLTLVLQNINVEIYNQKASLKLLDTLNLSTGDAGLMDMQMEQARSLIKFLEVQQDMIQKVAILTHQD